MTLTELKDRLSGIARIVETANRLDNPRWRILSYKEASTLLAELSAEVNEESKKLEEEFLANGASNT